MIAQVTETAQLNMPIPADLVADLARMRSHMRETTDNYNSILAENSNLLSRIYGLEEENASQAETITSQLEEIDRLHSRINKYDKYHIWLNKLFGNKRIPMAVKLVLWQYYMVVSLMRPNPTDECQMRMDLVAESIGVDSVTVRRATDKAEEFDLLTRRYQTVEQDGETRKYVHIALDEVVIKNPEAMQMEKRQGGKRQKGCRVDGTPLDNWTVRNCPTHGEISIYRQPGTRREADDMLMVDDIIRKYEDRIHNALARNPYEKQDAFEQQADLCNEKQDAFAPDPVIEVSNRLETAIDQADRKIKKFSQAPTNAEKQDAFQPAAQPVTEHTGNDLCGKLQKQDAFQKWGPVEIKPVPVCHAQIQLNAKGQRARKIEKQVSTKVCGSTRWQWSEEDNCRICAECWTPQL